MTNAALYGQAQRPPMRWLVVAVGVLVAGCASEGPTDDATAGEEPPGPQPPTEAQPPGKPDPAIATEPPRPDTPLPLLVELSPPELLEQAAVLQVEQGQFAIVRLIYEEPFWQWRDDLYQVHTVTNSAGPHAGVSMFAATRVAGGQVTDAVDITFSPRADLRSATTMSSTGPLPVQKAWLVGSHEGPVTWRIGLHHDKDPGEADRLVERPQVAIRPDAVTADAGAGSSVRMYVGGALIDEQLGDVEVVRAYNGQAPLAVEKSTSINFDADAPAGSTYALMFTAIEPHGIDEWTYSMAARGDVVYDGLYVHNEPGAGGPPGHSLSPVKVRSQGLVADQGLSFQAERSFSGLEDTVGAAGPKTLEDFFIGYAAVDLSSLYGWDVTDESLPTMS